jgi:hypothetical protein
MTPIIKLFFGRLPMEEGEAGLYMRWMVVELESIVNKLFNNGDAGIKLALPPLLGHAQTSPPPSNEKQKAASLGTPATKSGRSNSGGQQLSNSANVATAVAQIKSPLFGFGCNSNSSSDHRGQDFEKILTAFYQKHNPSKVAEVNSILKKFKGHEATMFKKLAHKYNTSNPLHQDVPPPFLPGLGDVRFASPFGSPSCHRTTATAKSTTTSPRKTKSFRTRMKEP